MSFNPSIALRLLRELRPAGRTLAGLLIASLIGLALGATPSDSVRYAGTVLQTMGLITVAVGLAELRRVFDRPSVKQVVAGWLEAMGLVWLLVGVGMASVPNEIAALLDR